MSRITNNRASMPVHLREHVASSGHVPGIFVLSPTMTMGKTVDDLVLIWGATDSEEYQDLLVYLPVTT